MEETLVGDEFVREYRQQYRCRKSQVALVKIQLPIIPFGKNTPIEKNPFHITINISNVVYPQIGHTDIIRVSTPTNPNAVAVGISFGL